MDGVESCPHLVHLYLYSNKIHRIQGLGRLVQLDKLWLNGNQISCVEGLDSLRQLRDLNLAGNCIRRIGSGMNNLQKLEILDLSGNQISSFEVSLQDTLNQDTIIRTTYQDSLSALQDLSPLTLLPRLRSLSLSHPHHPPNPLSLLCNYSSLLLYHFPLLETLDGQDVATPEIKQLIKVFNPMTSVLKELN